MDSNAVAIVGAILLVMLGVFAVPTIIDATDDPQRLHTDLEIGDTIEVTDGLSITVTDSTNSDVTVEVIDAETQQNQTLTISEGSTAAYSLPGGDGEVKNKNSTNQAASLSVTYDPTYGYTPAAQMFIDNLGLILILLLFVFAGGAIVVIT